MAENAVYITMQSTAETEVVPVGAAMARPTTNLAPAETETHVVPAPPPYNQVAETDEQENCTDTTPLVSNESPMTAPPDYNIATDLPSYEEAERSKVVEEERRQTEEGQRRRTLFFGWVPSRNATSSDHMLGTDGIFVCTFLLAFLFNWLGLLASLCVTQTIAGRLGALSGFGLSLVKYMLLFSHSGFGASMHGMDAVIWWLLVAVGILLFFRGVSQYIRVKYHWPNLSPENRRTMFNHYY